MAYYGGHRFEQDNDGFVKVFTDGSCEGNGTAQAAAGYGVYWGENHQLNTSEPVRGDATHDVAGLQAATCAIRTARGYRISKLAIYTNSYFVIDSVTMPLSIGDEVHNTADFVELHRELSAGNMKVKCKHVCAHSGNLGNDRSDQLAHEGIRMYRNQRL